MVLRGRPVLQRSFKHSTSRGDEVRAERERSRGGAERKEKTRKEKSVSKGGNGKVQKGQMQWEKESAEMCAENFFFFFLPFTVKVAVVC